MHLCAPFGGLSRAASVPTFDGKNRAAFVILGINKSKVKTNQFHHINYVNCNQAASAFYFYYNHEKFRKKPGPKNSVPFVHVKRTLFGDRLFRITRSKKITFKELGAKIGISNRMVTYYQTNEMGPPLEILKRMASTLDVTLAYLVDESPLKIVRDDNVSPTVRKHIDTLKKLPLQEQKPIFHMITLAARNSPEKGNIP